MAQTTTTTISLLLIALLWLAGNSAAFTLMMATTPSRPHHKTTALSTAFLDSAPAQQRGHRLRRGLGRLGRRLFKRGNKNDDLAHLIANNNNNYLHQDVLMMPPSTLPQVPTSSPLVSTKLETSHEAPKEETTVETTETTASNNKNVQTMKFIGTQTVVSDPSPLTSSLSEFFRNNRDLLFPNNEAVAFTDPLTVELAEKWTELAALGGGSAPDYNTHADRTVQLLNTDTTHHQVFSISAPLQMPGLSITSESTIGCRLITSNNNMPEYQFTLLDSKLSAKGPAKWMFSKMTKYLAATYSFTRVTAEPSEQPHHSTDSIVFRTQARLETRINLPRAAARMNVGRFERQGSQAVQQLLTNELGPALHGFRHAYSATATTTDYPQPAFQQS